MKIQTITCTGNYRKEHFLKTVNSIADYFLNHHSKIDIMLSNDFENQTDISNINKEIKY